MLDKINNIEIAKIKREGLFIRLFIKRHVVMDMRKQLLNFDMWN